MARQSKMAWAAAAVLLGAGIVAGCPSQPGGDPGACTGAFCLNESARLEVEPPNRALTIEQASVDVGGSIERPVRIRNTGTAVLQVLTAALEYDVPEGASDGDVPALALVPPAFELPAAVYPRGGPDYPQGAEFSIRYTRQADAIPREATLVLTSNDPTETEVRVRITTEAGAPSLFVSDSVIDFSLVPKGQVATGTLTMTNTGSRTLSVSGFRVDDIRFGVRGEGFQIGGGAQAALSVDLVDAIAIAPGESRDVEVSFSSDSPAPAEGTLLIYSDDPESGAAGYPITLRANKSGPCILVSPRDVAFGGKIVGSLSSLPLEVTSCGTEPLVLTKISLRGDSSPDFSLDFSGVDGVEAQGPSAAAPLTIPINATITLHVTYVPDEVNPKDADNVPIPDEGAVALASNAFESEVEVPLTGAGADAECPTAVIKVAEGEEVTPQTVLHLDGTQSFAPFGSIQNYSWSVEQPDGSQETFVPSPSDPQPIFAVNVVGAYTFRLRVRDAGGTWSCEDAEFVVLVQPDQAIHVELTWVTPGDPDETDTGEAAGSDLDLHFTHPNATGPDLDGDGAPDPWFDEEYDCFWHNPTPNWGSFDPSAGDDPTLDRDDTDGAGPENLNLQLPETNSVYRVGVHYWNDHGFGPARATLRVYSYATLVYEAADVELKQRDMWCVASVTWDGAFATVEPCGDGETPSIVPDYVNPFFFQP